ncbi:MAG: UDP-4-amino-4,6-dideoxy-N-acetyl-beta-L-altrosamine transaminase [Candidatus Peribacteraceae bacterium]|jgi:perosamine synthetase|nr:UDP-4-amino-4,6-dideoxy-N-acetyl-beta-L-altrosamine transaminase [Candidatus Peribacteraceae bacterium]MDP7454645.1 UDP-4-amino-4,6-dideoxy-N-acetyl-beta-L-altrosamine transaminase [Candidatus Peribacteraceae bacterium]MDP7645816.1 UDP-4-amino-4,6-dideoxy-N-acetyl-beta-L-altrosamine transaminase [Candidatus Peribacteraceae bacterium]
MSSALAINGGKPIRDTLLPYSRQLIGAEDIEAVIEVLKSDWLTTGPKIQEFEKEFASFVGANDAVAVSNGTAALHASMFATGISEGDEVIVPAMTFVSTANSVVFQKGTPVFVDTDPDSLLIDPKKVEEAITKKTKAIVAVDYTGQPCDYDSLSQIAEKNQLTLIADACHALGGMNEGQSVGSLADLSTFSFHAVKPIATGEGGMITTNNPHFPKVMREFRNHCISSDHRERHEAGSWFYEVDQLGFNYRLTDFQCALGLSQLKKVPKWTSRRQEIAQIYDKAFSNLEEVTPLKVREDVSHTYHLYVVKLELDSLRVNREEIFKALRAENIGVNVHYIPVHLHPFYVNNYGTKEGQFPNVESAYERILSLPMFTAMNNEDVKSVIEAMEKVITHYSSK